MSPFLNTTTTLGVAELRAMRTAMSLITTAAARSRSQVGLRHMMAPPPNRPRRNFDVLVGAQPMLLERRRMAQIDELLTSHQGLPWATH